MKQIERLIDNHAIRDESEPNRPTLSLDAQPWWIKVIVKFLRIREGK